MMIFHQSLIILLVTVQLNNLFVAIYADDAPGTCTADGSCGDEIPPVIEEIDAEPVEVINDTDPVKEMEKYGKPQRVEGDESERTLSVILATIKYMNDLLKYEAPEALTCKNDHELCSFWAGMPGECSRSNYMRENCGPSCQTCIKTEFIPNPEVLEEITKYGVPQKVEGETAAATFAVVESALEHVKLMQKSLPSSIFQKCRNEHELCSFWAQAGECENNSKYMRTGCAASCQSCDKIKRVEDESGVEVKDKDEQSGEEV